MSDEVDIKEAVDNLVDFAEFFLRLGELQVQQVLLAIADRDPEFTYFCEALKEPPQTLLDLFLLYGRWVIDKLKMDSGAVWNDVVEQTLCSDRHRVLRMQWEKTSLLWEEWEGLVGTGSES